MDERIRKAEESRYIVTHPLVVSAFRDIEAALNDALTNAPEKDMEGIKNLVLTKKCLKRFKAAFEKHIETGKIAAKELEAKRPILRRMW